MTLISRENFSIETNSLVEVIIKPAWGREDWLNMEDAVTFFDSCIVPFATSMGYFVVGEMSDSNSIVRIDLRKNGKYTVFCGIATPSPFGIRIYSKNMSMVRLDAFTNSLMNHIQRQNGLFRTR